jgi:two-component system phosphate regulon sensor histidine kinase PhoR
MIRMVHGMLELSRLESEPRPEPVPVDAGAALAQAVQALAREAEARGVRIEGDLAGVPAVLATPDGLVQVFRNLLENGVRFSPAGGVVRVAAVRQGRDVAFSVSDQGPGIPPDRLERVFERFYTIGGAGAGGAGSTGLGLAICRHIVRGLGGEIRAYSPAGSAPGRSQTLATGPGQAAGAAFVFTLRAADRSG